jgi:broad specificity phosphatase PhoE
MRSSAPAGCRATWWGDAPLLILVRHGQTSANAAGLIQGQSDYDLTPLGRQQVAVLQEAVPAGAAVITSPLRRARQTAEALGRPVEVDDRWLEMDYGDYEGRLVADVRPELWSNWERDPAWAPPGGESLAAVARRIAAACVDLAYRATDADIVVVTHVGPIKAAVAWALGVGPQIAGRMFVGLASVTTIAYGRDGVPVLRSFSVPSSPGTGGRAGSAG